jgi:hypothetical protein
MTDIPELRELVLEAARRNAASAPAASRQQRSGLSSRFPGPRALIVGIALISAFTAAALAAVGVFQRGRSIGPEVGVSATTAEGMAIPGTVRLLSLRVADPGGGPPWGVRVVRTTRGLTCVDVGRVDFSTIGVLGQDGAFANDGRFHPISENVYGEQGCVTTDARGNGFVNVALQNIPASALLGGPSSAGGCRVAEEPPQPPVRPTCPQPDMREIYFGLLGPDARSITYREPGGGSRTIATAGARGAYLLVFHQATKGCLAPSRLHGSRPACPYGGRGQRGGPEVPSGRISTITYRDGHTCHVPAPGTYASMFGACPPVGFVSPPPRRLTTARLATPITVRELPAKRYCASQEVLEPCEGRIPHGFRLVTGGWPALLVQISFNSRIAIPDSHSYYRIEMSYAHHRGCTTGGSGGPTDSDIRAGQRVVQRSFVPYRCPGIVHGTLSYVPTEGAAGSTPVIGLPGQGKPVPVGRFSFVVP